MNLKTVMKKCILNSRTESFFLNIFSEKFRKKAFPLMSCVSVYLDHPEQFQASCTQNSLTEAPATFSLHSFMTIQ